jgi:hypothetical protein
MIPCESIRNLLSEFIDGELHVEQAEQVESHLGDCDECSMELQALRLVDQQLSGVLVIDDFDGKVLQATAAARNATTDISRIRSLRFAHWFGVFLAIAATLLLGFFFWPPSNSENVVLKEVAAHLVSATGPVEIWAADDEEWRTVLPSDAIALQDGMRVRTANAVRCEIRTKEQGKVRLDRECEIVVNDSQQLELVSGKLWCSAALDHKFNVNVPLHGSEQPVVAMFTCPSKSAFECESTPARVSCSTPAGPASDTPPALHLGEAHWPVQPGEKIVVDNAQAVSREPRSQAADLWQLPLLALSDDSRSELSGYLQKLLAPIGRSKVQHMNETQIQALGPAGAIPLLSFVVHEQDAERHLRRTAMRLAAETADDSAIPLLRQLTADGDATIASSAVRLLDKLAKS